MNLVKRWWIVLGLSCLILVTEFFTGIDCSIAQAAPLIVAQSTVQDLQQQQQSIETQRSQLAEERDRLKNLEKAAQKTFKGLQKNVTVTASQIQSSETRLQAATKALTALEGKLATTETAYQYKQSGTIARLQFLQRQPLERGWALLLQSQSMNQFLDRRYRLRQIYRADREILTGLKTIADRVETQRNQVEQQKNAIALLTQQLLSQKSDIEGQLIYQKSSIERLKSDRRAMELAETQLEQDSHTISSLIQQRAGQGSIAFRGNGAMQLPCLGEITSGFGWRMHPVLGYERFHSGLDFGADYGTTIYAAEQGIVIFAGWYGGYGNAVIIDHGGNVTTLYGHTSEFYVSEGQMVQRGQAIAAVGSTGLSTGPHLHFEVRRDGEPTDPLAYL